MTSFLATGPSLGGSRVGAWLAGLSLRSRILLISAEVVVMLALWQLVVGVFRWINPVFVPAPLSIFSGLGDILSSGAVAANAPASLQAWVVGFGLALVIAIPLGLLLGVSLPVDRIVGPIAWAIYATPSVAYQPLAKAWFGFGIGPVVFLVLVSAVFPIMFNLAAGIRTTNTSIISAAKVYGASKFRLYPAIYLPSTVPFLFAGLRQGVVLATIGMMVAELSGAAVGMGALIIRSTNTYQVGQAFAAIMLVVIFTISMVQVTTLVERWVAPWTRGAGK
ncbi:permease protein of ABC transporter [marine actinobacterium PHSC20C1]|nr:permease protein of ABC transporter [marine actinobacterium PHSC20C1]